MKVLHVLDHSVPLFSGYSFRSLSIVEAQRELGLQPVVVTSPKQGSSGDEIESLHDVSYYRTSTSKSPLGVLPFLRELELMWRLGRRIQDVAKKENVDLIHSHSPLLNGLPALKVARHLGVPVVYEARAFWEDAAVDLGTFTEGSLRYRISRELENYLFRRADGVVTICDNMDRELGIRGIRPTCMRVMPNGVDTERFRPSPRNQDLVERLQLGDGVVFGFIGSFYHYEGLRFLVKAFRDLIHRVPGARLLLVGGGPEAPEINEMSKLLDGAIVMLDRVPHNMVDDYYSIIDIFVYPRLSLRITELVTPLKPLEAMAMGKAVLASDVGGHKELILDGKTGHLFAANNSEDFIDRASQLARDPQLRQRLGEAGRDYVKRERSWNRLVRRYLPMYEEVLAGMRRREEICRKQRASLSGDGR